MKMITDLIQRLKRFLRPSLEKKPKRICIACGQQIRRHDKYRLSPIHRRPRHKDCMDPTLAGQRALSL